MKRLTFLVALGSGLAAPLWAQPPAGELDTEIRKVTTKKKELKEKAERASGSDAAFLNMSLGFEANYLGSLWEEKGEWAQAGYEYLDAFFVFNEAYNRTKKPENARPSQARACLDRARMEWKLGRYKEVLSLLKEARGYGLESFNLAEADGVAAQAQAMLGDFSAARASVLSCLRLRESASKPRELQDKANAHRLLAAIAYLQGDITEAKSRWQDAAKVDGRFGDKDLFDPKQAPLNAAVAKNPKDVTARLVRARYLRQRGSLKEKDEKGYSVLSFDDAPLYQGGVLNVLDLRSPLRDSFEESALADALVALDAAADDDPAPYLERFLAGESYKRRTKPRQVKDYGEGAGNNAPYLRIALDYGKGQPEILLGAAEYFKERDPNLARDLIGRGLLAAPDPGVWSSSRTWRAEQLKSLPSAKLPTPPPGVPKTALEWKERGNVHNAGGDWRSALECYEKAVALDPTFADAYNNIGSVYINLRCHDLARTALDRAIALDPKHRLASLLRAPLWESVGKLDSAVADLKNAVLFAQTPELRAATNTRLAQVALQQFRPAEAKAAAEEALKLFPTDTNAGLARARAQLLLGQDQDTLTTLGKLSGIEAEQLRCTALLLADPGDKPALVFVPAAKAAWDALRAKQTGGDAYTFYAFLRNWLKCPLAPMRETTRLKRLRDLCFSEVRRELWK